MAYTNKVTVAVATAVLLLAVATTPQWTDAQTMPNLNPVCAVSIPEIVQNCYTTMTLIPSEDCCNDLKTANSREVTCLCDNFIAHPINTNLTRAIFDQINIACGVLDKYACKGGANGGAPSKIGASMGLFVLVASLFF